MFLCDKDGKYLRRIGFDQTQTSYPTVLNSGEILYTRWDYNDRTHTYSHALFVMNPDGSHQREYYGNNSWFPPAIYMGRAIPNSNKVMSIFAGYHVWSCGMWALVDNNVATNNVLGELKMKGAWFLGRTHPGIQVT